MSAPARKLVLWVNKEPRADSRLLALRLGVDRKNVMELVRRYQGKFEPLGLLRFQTRAVKRVRGKKYRTCVRIEEAQRQRLLLDPAVW